MTIDLATAKQHLRLETTDEDALVTAYLAAAISLVEVQTSKLLAQRTVTQPLSGFPARGEGPIRLWYGPVAADGLTITYDDGNGDEQTLADFRLVEGSNARLLPAYGATWPTAFAADGSVRIAYTAGYVTDEVPPELEQAVLMLVAHFYLNREAVGGAAAAEIPLGVDALIAGHRPVGIG